MSSATVLPELPTTPSMRLDGRRALVTGAGRGLGLACASALAEAGAEVVLAARGSREIDTAADAIRARGGRASSLALDITDTRIARSRIDSADPFHILLNNAGGNRPQSFLDVTEPDFDFIFQLNVRAAFFVGQAVAAGMVEHEIAGSIINMSSQMGHVGAPRRTVYCASKHAIEGLTKAMAVELGPFGIRVNTVAPTFIETPMTRPFFEDDEFRASVLGKIKLGRIGRVEDLMGAVVFLASGAAALMTGACLSIDGGWTAD